MEPIPETAEVLKELLSYGDSQMAVRLLRLGRRVRDIAPDCIGLSYAVLGEEDITFTLVATDSETAKLDAVQYVSGGPCVEAAQTGKVIEQGVIDPLSEEEWASFARAGAAAGVASSLSIPLMKDGRVRGGVNLYGSTPHAFTGCVDELARVCQGWAPGAVHNADLTFSTRAKAMRAPQQLEDQKVIDVAVGILAEAHGVDLPTAEDRLRHVAARAGLPLVEAAQAVLSSFDQ